MFFCFNGFFAGDVVRIFSPPPPLSPLLLEEVG